MRSIVLYALLLMNGLAAAKSSLLESTPPLIHGAGVAWTGSEIYQFGGIDVGTQTYVNDLYVFSVEDRRWRKIEVDGAPGVRYRPAVAWTGKRLIVFGGYVEGSKGARHQDGATYDPEARASHPCRLARFLRKYCKLLR